MTCVSCIKPAKLICGHCNRPMDENCADFHCLQRGTWVKGQTCFFCNRKVVIGFWPLEGIEKTYTMTPLCSFCAPPDPRLDSGEYAKVVSDYNEKDCNSVANPFIYRGKE